VSTPAWWEGAWAPSPEGPLPVVGFRAFRATQRGGVLTSYSHSYEWEPGNNTSVPCSMCVSTMEVEVIREHLITDPLTGNAHMEICTRGDHCSGHHYVKDRKVKGAWPAHRDCRCGFWAAHTLEELMEQQYGHQDSYCIIGGIIGWGRVQIGTKLWRAQFAKIMCLTDGIPIKAVMHKGRTLRWLHDNHPPERMEKAIERYNVPVVPLTQLVKFMAEHGESGLPSKG
jgi:hypothetical protein